MEAILLQHFEFQSPVIKNLDGYDNANYLVENNETKYIFKTYKYDAEQLAIIKTIEPSEFATMLSSKPNT